jgi:hypothetical protein
VCVREGLLLPSPSFISASTARSKFPLSPFSTVAFRFSSKKPISLSVASLDSKLSPGRSIFEPNTRDGLLTLGGLESLPTSAPKLGDMGGVSFPDEGRDIGKVDEAARNPNPNFFVGLGGSGGGRSSTELVLPVFCLVPGLESVLKTRCSYFCRMYRSIAPSTSSTSIGIEGLMLRGLYVRFDSELPMRFIFYNHLTVKINHEENRRLTSMCSLLQLSMLNDLTFEMCVPSLRCNAAHRIQRNMPNCTTRSHG